MSWSLAVARRSYCAVTLSCRGLSLHSIQHRRPHASPPVLLARSYSSDIADSRFRLRRRLIIQTLDPSRLRPSDFIDGALAKPGKLSTHLRPKRSYYCDFVPFPEGARGFLYYHPPNSGDPPAAGYLRFRLTPGNDPASFIHGSDLQMSNGLPWGIPLLTIAGKSDICRGSKTSGPLRQLLIDDGLVAPELLKTCRAMLNASKATPRHSSRIMHSFGQLFHVDFNTVTGFRFFTLTMNQLHRLSFYSIFCEALDGRFIAPYLGSALCCFERSTLPQHTGTRTVVIRIVKILSPPICVNPNYHGRVPLPVEGELVHYIHKRLGLQPRSLNVDSPRYTHIRMLFRDES